MQYSEKKVTNLIQSEQKEKRKKEKTWLSHSRFHVADQDTDPKSNIHLGNRSHDASQPIVMVRVVTHEALRVTSFIGL